MTITTHAVINQSPLMPARDLYADDALLQAVTSRYAADADFLKQRGKIWGSQQMDETAALANLNSPELLRFDSKGYALDTVRFHPAYHQLMQTSAEGGLHCSSWQSGGTQLTRAGLLYQTSQVECGHVCPMTMTHAALAALRHQPDLFAQWSQFVCVRDYDPRFLPAAQKRAVTLGMGMTEKQGGTDVRSNTSRAVAVADGYRLSGHKWFLSAPMCDAFLMLAQEGDQGLSCFLVPRFCPDDSVNNLEFQRLKNKLGNKSNASSEVEFTDAFAWRVGESGRGIATIIEMVSLTRLDCAVSSAGLMHAALVRAIHHCRHRQAFGKPLIEQPLMQQTLASLALEQAACTALSLRLAHAIDQADSDEVQQVYARVLTPASKYLVCKTAPAFTYEAMECLGGNGYIDDEALARAYREAPVNAIWEGSGNVMCLDIARVLLKQKISLSPLLDSWRELLDASHLSRLQEMAGALGDNPASGRALTETLAKTAACAALHEIGWHDAAEAYAAMRLDASAHNSYGAGAQIANPRALIDSVYA